MNCFYEIIPNPESSKEENSQFVLKIKINSKYLWNIVFRAETAQESNEDK